jgi:C4-dicarboxylate transporter
MFKDILLIILGAGLSSAYFFWQSYKDKKEIKKQERLNAIKTK